MAEKKQQKKKEDKENKDELDIDELLAAHKKRQRKKIGAGAAGFLVFLLVWFLFQPVKGGIEFGVCKTYVEQYVRYPGTLKLTEYDIFGRSFRIFHTYRDAFGMHHSEMIECIAVQDPVKGLVMQQIKIDRKPIAPEKLDVFNRSIPAILTSPMDLSIPRLKGDEDLLQLRPPD